MTSEMQKLNDESPASVSKEIDFASPREEIENAWKDLNNLFDAGKIEDFITRNRVFAEFLSTFWKNQFKQAARLLNLQAINPFELIMGGSKCIRIMDKEIQIYNSGGPFNPDLGLSINTPTEEHDVSFHIYNPSGVRYGTMHASSEFRTGLQPNQQREYYVIGLTVDFVEMFERVQEFVDPKTGFQFERRNKIVPDHDTLAQHTYRRGTTKF